MTKLSLINRSRTPTAVVLAALLLTASTMSPLHAGDQIPFKGYIIVTGEPVGEPAGSFQTLRFTGPGRSTLLGNITVEATATLNLDTLEYTGSAVWTVSNGDLFFATFEGQLVPTSEQGIFENHETFAITGGTGRLEGATGGGVAEGIGNPFAGLLAPFQGTISSPGANKQ